LSRLPVKQAYKLLFHGVLIREAKERRSKRSSRRIAKQRRGGLSK
jgi:hypothetical protein